MHFSKEMVLFMSHKMWKIELKQYKKLNNE